MKTILPRVMVKPSFIVFIFVFAQNLFAGDISFYAVLKEQDFVQTNNAAPPSDTNAPFFFQCVVDSNGPGLISDASVQLPSGGSRTLLPEDNDDEFAFREIFSSLSALNATYGTGTYTLTVGLESSDVEFAQMPMPADAYPTTPQITNYTDAQSINPGNDFTFGWLPFVGGTENDFVEFTIRDSSDNEVFRSPDLGSPGALNGTNLSFVVPSGTLFPGETYQGELFFARPTTLDSTSIPGANGVVAFTKRTRFDVKTTGSAPSIALQAMGLIDGHFQFSFNTQPGKNYQIQFADTLPNWQNLWFTNAPSNEIIFTDTSAVSTSRFYRVTAP